MATMRLDPKLAARIWINLQDRRSSSSQVLNQPGFLELAGFEKAQEASWVLSAGDPAEIKPERSLTVFADQRSAKVGSKSVPSVGLVGREDRVSCRAADAWQFSHAAPPVWLEALGHG
ncbi:MAG: hypothetical protein ACOVPA_22960 [Rubrivivax sp.]